MTIDQQHLCILLSGLLLALTLPAFADKPPERSGKRTPPPEAYTACEEAAAGASVTVTLPHGESVAATCRDLDGRLVAFPDSPPPRHGGGPRGEDGVAPEAGGEQ
ncbi:MAG: hypothetical protein C0621_10820 [Desulfuromonas sp.]|nr:MAG: hypothetical protein C0621_10820 [Desulfuromonas sp.]